MHLEMNWLVNSFLLRIASAALVISGIFGASSVVQSHEAKPGKNAETDEPIFSLTYDPRKVHFGVLKTADLLPTCKEMLSDVVPLPPTLTLYAQYKERATAIFIVGTDDNLKILVLRNGICDAGIPILAILQRHHNPRESEDGPMLSDEEVSGLFSDALVRYSQAFGGNQKFLRWLDSLTEQARRGCKGQPEFACPPSYHLLQPALQNKLEEFRKQSH